jgi:hypothetical protein
MDSEQIRDFHLLYNAVYDEDLREQFDEYNNTIYDEDIVEVATEYFYAYGLNEDGIDILIEKVGLDSFVEYVYDLSEDLHILTEERAAKRRTGGPSYEDVKAAQDAKETKAAAKKAAKKNVTTAATEKKEVESKEPETRGPESEAKAQQPKGKKPVRDAIARTVFGALKAYETGMARHRSATSTAGHLAKETGKTLGKVVSTTHEAGRRAGEHVKTHGWKSIAREEVELWVNNLLEEGYDLSEYSWDDMFEIYEESDPKYKPKTKEELARYVSALDRLHRMATEVRGPEPSEKKKKRKPTTDMRNVAVHEDLYDVILSHLLDEGYAESVEQAEVIMVNMSRDWLDEIYDQSKDGKGSRDRVTDRPHKPKDISHYSVGVSKDESGKWWARGDDPVVKSIAHARNSHNRTQQAERELENADERESSERKPKSKRRD